MYEIKENKRIVRGKRITTFSRKTESGYLEVEAGTNGYCGGDSGHGGTTYFRILPDECGPLDIHFKVLQPDDMSGIEVCAGGDWELKDLITSLEFILQALKDGIEAEDFDPDWYDEEQKEGD